jgi:hypothetical protein
MQTNLKYDARYSVIPKKTGEYSVTSYRMSDDVISVDSQLRGLGRHLNKYDVSPFPLGEVKVLNNVKSNIHVESEQTRQKKTSYRNSNVNRFENISYNANVIQEERSLDTRNFMKYKNINKCLK